MVTIASMENAGGAAGTELVVLVGLPGAGKTSFFRDHFQASHVHVSKDLMRNARDRNTRQGRLIEEALRAGRSVVVDNINPTIADRAPLVALARAHGARVVAYVLDTTIRTAVARNRRREGEARVPDVAIFMAAKRLEVPTVAEGLDAVYRVRSSDGRFEVAPW
jgi:predicted kinase